MRLGLMLGYWGAQPNDPIDLVREAEQLGYDSAWFAEAYGSDVFSPLSWVGARTWTASARRSRGVVRPSAWRSRTSDATNKRMSVIAILPTSWNWRDRSIR